MKEFKLSEKTSIPALGLGTWLLTGQDCVNGVTDALEIGYRHIDTADMYGNHIEVRKGIEQSGIKRNEFFLTSKVQPSKLKYQDLIDCCKRNLDELGTDYLDLYLMHWPNRKINLKQTFDAFEFLKAEGLIKEWGVSNCNIHHLSDISKNGYTIVNNQVEFHPTLNQKELKEYCDKNNILITAYSPLGHGEDLALPQVTALAEKYECSAAQVLLNWVIKKGMVAIPKASKKERIHDNFKTLSWELSDEDFAIVDNLNQDLRTANPPFADFDY